MTKIPEITDEQLTSETGYYHGVHVVLHFHKEDGVDRKEEHVDVDLDTDGDEMEYVKLDDKRYCH